MKYTLELRLREEDGTVVEKIDIPLEVENTTTLGFGEGAYGDGGFGE